MSIIGPITRVNVARSRLSVTSSPFADTVAWLNSQGAKLTVDQVDDILDPTRLFPYIQQTLSALVGLLQSTVVWPELVGARALQDLAVQHLSALAADARAKADAWRDEDNHWVAQLQWQAGRTTNAAHWRYQPDAHGGTIVALDDTAFEHRVHLGQFGRNFSLPLFDIDGC